jgi:hypothetical protein
MIRLFISLQITIYACLRALSGFDPATGQPRRKQATGGAGFEQRARAFPVAFPPPPGSRKTDRVRKMTYCHAPF